MSSGAATMTATNGYHRGAMSAKTASGIKNAGQTTADDDVVIGEADYSDTAAIRNLPRPWGRGF